MRTELAVLRDHWQRLGLVQARDFVLVAAVHGTAQARERCAGETGQRTVKSKVDTHLHLKSLCLFVSRSLYYCCFNTIKITLKPQNQTRPSQ